MVDCETRMTTSSGLGYDRGISFTPDGRIFQVEYALNATRRGAPVIGISTDSFVVLVATKKISSRLLKKSSLKKLFVIDTHVFSGASGLSADFQMLINYAQLQAQNHMLLYGERIPLLKLTKMIARLMHSYTQFSDLRPFGVSLLIAGHDEKKGIQLYLIEPSGAYWEYYAVAIGQHATLLEKYLETKYTKTLNINKAIKLGVNAIKQVEGQKITPEDVEIGVISSQNPTVHLLNKEELKTYLY